MEIADAEVLLVRTQRRSSHGIAHLPDPDDDTEPRCDPHVHREDATYNRVLADRVPAKYRLCKHCDPDHVVTHGPAKGERYLADILTSDYGPDDLVTDGGRSIEDVLEDGYDEWCDWCDREYENGPTYRVEASTVTGHFCRRQCAEQWKPAAGEVERIDQPPVRADGGVDIELLELDVDPIEGLARCKATVENGWAVDTRVDNSPRGDSSE